MTDFTQELERVAAVATKHAANVDEDARFPQETVDTFLQSGLGGLVSASEFGGKGGTLRDAATVIERLARECGSSAMILAMHYSGVFVIEQYGDEATRRDVANGKHLSTLAFSEAGSRSHFWAPLSTAKADNGHVTLDAKKSWITSANYATAYVWSSQPCAAEGMSTIWLVPREAEGLQSPGPFRGLGLRGNDSTPVSATGVKIPAGNRLGEDGQGFDVMMSNVLPNFSVLNAACSIGLMEAISQNASAHCAGTGYQHLDSKLADLPTIRAYLARMRGKTDMVRSLWLDTISALEAGREDAMLRVLEVKAFAGEESVEVGQLGMRVCGGAAYRKEVGVERRFRDAQAAIIMAPTTDVLYDFIGKAVTGMELFG